MRASFFCIFCLFACLCPSFLPCHPPPPSFIFWLSFHLSRGQNRKSRSSVFFCSETKRKHLLRRLFVSYFNWESLLVQHEFVLNFLSTRRLLEHTRASTQRHDSVVTICTITDRRKLSVFSLIFIFRLAFARIGSRLMGEWCVFTQPLIYSLSD